MMVVPELSRNIYKENLMKKYKVSYLPTARSRKIKSFFLYASSNKIVINNAKDELKRRFRDGALISIQGPDYSFIDLEVAE